MDTFSAMLAGATSRITLFVHLALLSDALAPEVTIFYFILLFKFFLSVSENKMLQNFDSPLTSVYSSALND